MLHPVTDQHVSPLPELCSEQPITGGLISGSETRNDFPSTSDVDVVLRV